SSAVSLDNLDAAKRTILSRNRANISLRSTALVSLSDIRGSVNERGRGTRGRFDSAHAIIGLAESGDRHRHAGRRAVAAGGPEPHGHTGMSGRAFDPDHRTGALPGIRGRLGPSGAVSKIAAVRSGAA